jgi:hypothetical protein
VEDTPPWNAEFQKAVRFHTLNKTKLKSLK